MSLAEAGFQSGRPIKMDINKLHQAPSLVIYMTYDGLLDPLGSSQILPYVESISAHPRSIHIISFEKPERLHSSGSDLRERLSRQGITWTPLTFTRSFGLIGKLWDLLRMYLHGFRIALSQKPQIVHARGHAAAQVGLFLKRWLGPKLLFDFRGLWVDERVDKGGWDLSRAFDRLQYRYYKGIERVLLLRADQIVVLTEAVVGEVVRLGAQPVSKIIVIPCCADFEHFALADEASCHAARTALGISQHAFVLGYLGSVGGMYMPDRFFRLVEFAAAKNSSLHILALTPDVERFNAEMQRYLPSRLHLFAHVRSANRDEVARFLPAMNALVAFARPSYARVSMSPTKLAESFAAGIPAICNYGVGDVPELMRGLDAGIVVAADSDEELRSVANALPQLVAKGGPRLRQAARRVLGLEVANERYRSVYGRLDSVC